MRASSATLRAAIIAIAATTFLGCGSRTPLGTSSDSAPAPALPDAQRAADAGPPDATCASCDVTTPPTECPGDPNAPICDIYMAIDRCPPGARRTVIGCRPLCQDVATCKEVPPLPPQTCSRNADCQPSEYCALDGQCVVSGAKAGTCQARPGPCPDFGHCPGVCGCDGKSYCDACEAHAVGVSVATTGGGCLASSCAGLKAAYAAELPEAKKCCLTCAAAQCGMIAAPLGCGCPTMVNILTAKMKALRAEWTARGCNFSEPPCGIKCAAPGPASCQPVSAPADPTTGICAK